MNDTKRKQTETYNDEIPLYNIRILRSYINYVRKVYPKIDIDKILDYAGVSKYQYNDFGYWCNQRQMNRLQEILVKETNNSNISRDTGRNLINTQNIISLYILGFINPANLTRQIERVYKKLSRAAIIKTKYIGNNRHELITTPIPGIKEEPYQCKNRIGSIEGLLKIFLHEYPRIEHPECYHKGATHCRYIVSWDKLGIFKWYRLRNYSIFLALFTPFVVLLLFSFNYFVISFLIGILGIAFLFSKIQTLEKEKLKDRIENLSEIVEEHWNELNISYRTTKLMQEVGSVTSVVQNTQEIASSVLQVMNKRLDYWRCVILLVDDEKKKLFYAESYGFTEDEISIIKDSWSSQESSNDGSIILKVLKKQEPILIDDINRDHHTLDAHDQKIAKRLKIQSMVCIPIIHEGESLGVLVMDHVKSRYEFREGDINLLIAVASQTALSIAHARAYRKLHESETKHRTLVETIRDIVYTVDLEGRFTYVSPMVAEIAGYTDRELLGKEFIEIVNSPYKEVVMQRFTDGIKSGKTSTYEIEILTKNKNTVPVELNVVPLTDNKGQTIGRIGVARDITRRHQEKAKRQEMEMRALAQDKLASVGEIATGVAHEINQPLSYIKIILESTLSDLETEQLNETELSGDFNESLRQVRKITNIITHLRTFGRSDVSSFSPVSLAKVLDDTLILMYERLRIKNIAINIQGVEFLPLLYGNHVKLEQVFVNLIQNSMDALEKKGKGEIALHAHAEESEAVIVHSDNGSGIDLKLQEKIFEPFFTTKEAGKGTGIGLSIVYGIIHEHKGTIICESEKGIGTTFTIRLPLYSEKHADSSTVPLRA